MSVEYVPLHSNRAVGGVPMGNNIVAAEEKQERKFI